MCDLSKSISRLNLPLQKKRFWLNDFQSAFPVIKLKLWQKIISVNAFMISYKTEAAFSSDLMLLSILNFILLDFTIPNTTVHLPITMFCQFCIQSFRLYCHPLVHVLGSRGTEMNGEHSFPFQGSYSSKGRCVNKYLIINAITQDPLCPLLFRYSLISIISCFWTCPGLVFKVEDLSVCTAITQKSYTY